MKTPAICLLTIALLAPPVHLPAQVITVSSLLKELTDLGNLARKPSPFFKQAEATSYDRRSHEGGDNWFANSDVGQYVRTEQNAGRTEQVLADLKGPGTITRIWSANPDRNNRIRFYFDGEDEPRLALPLSDLFSGSSPLFRPEFSYLSGTGGNLYFPLPYARSLKITAEDESHNLRLYYEIGYRSYEAGTKVRSFDPRNSGEWAEDAIQTGMALSSPQRIGSSGTGRDLIDTLTIRPDGSGFLKEITGERAVVLFAVRVRGLRETADLADPLCPDVALRHLILKISFDGETCIETPLGDFFGSGPGLNPYENLLFTVTPSGWMYGRLVMPFQTNMTVEVVNAGPVPLTVDCLRRVSEWSFDDRSYHLKAQWGSITRNSWPPFDVNFLNTTGSGKVIGTVYEISNPSYIWWGEGDQKIRIDGESFPSTFGTGTEDDYGFAYGYNGLFTRPFHAQTRVDGPASGGHISLNRWYVADALPYRTSVRFDQEMWHWMPCRPVWSHVIYWYAAPGTPGPQPVDPAGLMPVDLGIRANQQDLIEGEDLRAEASGGKAEVQRLANCSGARHLVWQDGKPGDSLLIHVEVPQAGNYRMMLNLCMSPDYGKYRFVIDNTAADSVIDCRSDTLYWQRPVLGNFHLDKGDNILRVVLMNPDPKAKPGNRFGLDYIFLERVE